MVVNLYHFCNQVVVDNDLVVKVLEEEELGVERSFQADRSFVELEVRLEVVVIYSFFDETELEGRLFALPVNVGVSEEVAVPFSEVLDFVVDDEFDVEVLDFYVKLFFVKV